MPKTKAKWVPPRPDEDRRQENGRRLREYLNENGISLRAAGETFAVSHPAVKGWCDGIAPGLDETREAIERCTGGAVRAVDWQSPDERIRRAAVSGLDHFKATGT